MIPLNEFNGGNNFPIFDRFSPTVENKPKFSNYLYFNVSVKTNTLMQTTDRYSTEQQELHDKIKKIIFILSDYLTTIFRKKGDFGRH